MRKIAIALVAATALFAADSAYNYELTPTIGGVHPEGNLGMNEQAAIGLRVGRNLENFFIDQVEAGFNYANKVREYGVKGRAARYFVNAIKDFGITENFSIYGLLGAGYEDVTKRFIKNKDGGFGQYGLGLKYKITDNFALRAEAVDAIKFDHADHNVFYTLGVAVGFGAKNAPGVAESPKMQEPAVVSLDDDNDGVLNDVDQCPNTPAGIVVDETGCEKVIFLRDLDVNFAFDSYKITPKYLEEIKKVAMFMGENPGYRIVLSGHTDSVGTEAYNQKLSEKRANAVAKALEELGVSADKITSIGYGELKPSATNKTKEGRAENRRVEARFNK